MSEPLPSGRDPSPIFLHSAVDDAGMSLAEFRVYAHIGRRGEVFSSIETIAEVCCCNRDTVWRALAKLETDGKIERRRRPGATSVFRLAPLSAWLTPSGKEGAAEKRGCPSKSAGGSGKEGAGGSGKEGVTPSGKEGARSISPEVTPLKAIQEGGKTPARQPFISELKIQFDAVSKLIDQTQDGKTLRELKQRRRALEFEIAGVPIPQAATEKKPNPKLLNAEPDPNAVPMATVIDALREATGAMKPKAPLL